MGRKFITNYFLLRVSVAAAIAVLFASCGTSRIAANNNSSSKENPNFLHNGAWIKPHEKRSSTTTDNNNYYAKKYSDESFSNKAKSSIPEDYNASLIQNKYAVILNVNSSYIQNTGLYKLIDDWRGTRYHYGGTGKSGIDCSSFAQMLEGNVYGKNLPRTSQQQYEESNRIQKSDLREGDLVFFHTIRGNYITHVGIYLMNNKFVHASINGVTISDLTENYWKKTYRAGGRFD